MWVPQLAYLCGERGSGRQHEYLARLLAHFGVSRPRVLGLQYAAELEGMRLRWERHRQFVS